MLSHVHLHQRSVCGDGVDKQCAEKGPKVPKMKYFINRHSANYHYTHVHIAHCLVIEDYKILMCKCSDVRSRGSDNHAHNRHYHCYQCYQPFDQPAQFARHLIIKQQVKEKEVIHVLPKNK